MVWVFCLSDPLVFRCRDERVLGRHVQAGGGVRILVDIVGQLDVLAFDILASDTP